VWGVDNRHLFFISREEGEGGQSLSLSLSVSEDLPSLRASRLRVCIITLSLSEGVLLCNVPKETFKLIFSWACSWARSFEQQFEKCTEYDRHHHVCVGVGVWPYMHTHKAYK
jgi:hypothetical protein